MTDSTVDEKRGEGDLDFGPSAEELFGEIDSDSAEDSRRADSEEGADESAAGVEDRTAGDVFSELQAETEPNSTDELLDESPEEIIESADEPAEPADDVDEDLFDEEAFEDLILSDRRKEDEFLWVETSDAGDDESTAHDASTAEGDDPTVDDDRAGPAADEPFGFGETDSAAGGDENDQSDATDRGDVSAEADAPGGNTGSSTDSLQGDEPAPVTDRETDAAVDETAEQLTSIREGASTDPESVTDPEPSSDSEFDGEDASVDDPAFSPDADGAAEAATVDDVAGETSAAEAAATDGADDGPDGSAELAEATGPDLDLGTSTDADEGSERPETDSPADVGVDVETEAGDGDGDAGDEAGTAAVEDEAAEDGDGAADEASTAGGGSIVVEGFEDAVQTSDDGGATDGADATDDAGEESADADDTDLVPVDEDDEAAGSGFLGWLRSKLGGLF